jgi:hypothetical protein
LVQLAKPLVEVFEFIGSGIDGFAFKSIQLLHQRLGPIIELKMRPHKKRLPVVLLICFQDNAGGWVLCPLRGQSFPQERMPGGGSPGKGGAVQLLGSFSAAICHIR